MHLQEAIPHIAMFVNFKCGFAEQALRALLFDHSPQSNRAPERLARGPVPSRDAQKIKGWKGSTLPKTMRSLTFR